MAPATRTAASMRPLVPFFVPGSLETNSALRPDTAATSTSTSAQEPTMVAVRKWDKVNGVFVDPQHVAVHEHRAHANVSTSSSTTNTTTTKTTPTEPVTPPRAAANAHAQKSLLLTPAAICARRTRKAKLPTSSTSTSVSSAASTSSASEKDATSTPPPNHLLKRRSMSCSPLLASNVPVSTPSKPADVAITMESTGSTVTPSTSSEALNTMSMAKYAGSTFEAASPAPMEIPIPRMALRRHSLAHSLDAIRVVREPPGGATKRLVVLTPT